MYLNAAERIQQDEVLKICANLERVLDMYCDDYSKPTQCFTGAYRSIKFAINPRRCTLMSVLRFIASLFNAGQLSRCQDTWATVLEVFGSVAGRSWEEKMRPCLFNTMDDISAIAFGKRLKANTKNGTMAFVGSDKILAVKLMPFSAVLSCFFPTRKCPYDEFFKMIHYDWKQKNLYHIVPENSKEVALKESIKDGFEYAEVDIDALI
jgi:hypothetical protein